MKQTFRILELAWLALSFFGFMVFCAMMLLGHRDQAPYLLIFTVVAGLMFLVRRKMRIKFEQPAKKETPEKAQ